MFSADAVLIARITNPHRYTRDIQRLMNTSVGGPLEPPPGAPRRVASRPGFTISREVHRQRKTCIIRCSPKTLYH